MAKSLSFGAPSTRTDSRLTPWFRAAARVGRRTLVAQAHPQASPRVLAPDKLGSYGARGYGDDFRSTSTRGLANRAENSQTRQGDERVVQRFNSARHLQRFVSIHDPIANLFHFHRHAYHSRLSDASSDAMTAWREIARARAVA